MSTPSPPETRSLPVSPHPKRQKTEPFTSSIDAAITIEPSTSGIAAVPTPRIPTPRIETKTLPQSPLQNGDDEMAAPIPPLQVKKLIPEAKLPTRGSAFAAGYDLYASRNNVVPAKGKVLVDTDISMAVPVGTYGRIAPRSGLASKHFIDTGAGVIDADYRGPVKVLLFNHAETDFPVKIGDRIAQLVLERIANPEVIEVAELEESMRGAGGFGSTGTN